MTQIRMGFRMGIFEYVKVTAERQGLWSGSPAHVVAHRLTARPRPWLGIGLQEMVTTAGRPLDWTYIIPFVPLKYTEHQLGDRDNIAMGFDVEALWAGRGRAYGEVMLDDFSGWDAEFWGNKFAFTLGAEAVDLPAAGSVLRAEYARVEAWTFTHHRRDGQMQHFGALLGSSLPANSHALRFAWEHPLPRNVEARLEYRLLQRDVTARGSSVFDVHDEARDGRTKEFLGGTVETRHEVALGGTWRWRRFVELRGTVGYLAAEDWKGVAGEAVSGATVAGEIYLRY